MREPDLIIGPRDNPYMHRWHLLRWRGWQLALHKIWRSDDDRALHDHRADNLSILLKGKYTEIRSIGDRGQVYGPCNVIFRKAEQPHRLVLDLGKPVWSIWLRWPSRREWYFHCPGRGLVHWKLFTAEQDYSMPGSTSTVGPGCDG